MIKTLREFEEDIFGDIIEHNLIDYDLVSDDILNSAESFLAINDITKKIKVKYDISKFSIKEMNDLFDTDVVTVINGPESFLLAFSDEVSFDKEDSELVNELIAKGDEILKNEEKLKEISTETLEDIASDLEDTDLIWVLTLEEPELTKYIKNSEMSKDLEAARRLISWIDSLNVLVSSELESRD